MCASDPNLMVKANYNILAPDQMANLLPLQTDSNIQALSSISYIPTLEDILNDSSKSTNSNQLNKYSFKEFLSKIHCLENFEFIVECKKYFKSCHKDPKECEKIWKNIYNNFIIENSDNEVNLPSNIKKQLLGYGSISSGIESYEFCDDSMDDDFIDSINPLDNNLPSEKAITQAYKIIKELLHDSYLEFVKNFKNQSNFKNNDNYCFHSSIHQRRKSEYIPPHIVTGNNERCISPLSPPFPAYNSNSNQSSCFSSPVHSNFSNYVDIPVPRTNYISSPPTINEDCVYQTKYNKNNSIVEKNLVSEDVEELDLDISNSNESNFSQNECCQQSNEDGLILSVLKLSTFELPIQRAGSSISISSHHNMERNRTSSSMTDKNSRGSSFGSIVGSFKNNDHSSWRKAVKKFKIRRFSNGSDSEQ